MGQKDSWGVKLPRVQRFMKGGKLHRYHRPTHTRLPDLPETHPEFIAAWAAAEAQARPKPKAKAGTVDEAVIKAVQSRAFKAFSPAYQGTIRRGLDHIRTEYTGLPFSGLRQHHIKADLAPLDPNPANARLKAWRFLCAAAVDARLIRDDPSDGIKKIRVSTDGHERWSPGDIDAFRARWPIGAATRACFELVLWTGARTADAVQMGRQHVGSDGILTFRQSKTGGPAYVPWTAPLPDYAAGWADDRQMMHDALQCLSGGLTFLEARGRPRSIKGLGNVINDGARDAGLTNRTAHGLRKARLSMIAECGGPAHAIMAWGGHKTLDEVQHYTASATMKSLVSGTRTERNDVNRPENAVNHRK